MYVYVHVRAGNFHDHKHVFVEVRVAFWELIWFCHEHWTSSVARAQLVKSLTKFEKWPSTGNLGSLNSLAFHIEHSLLVNFCIQENWKVWINIYMKANTCTSERTQSTRCNTLQHNATHYLNSVPFHIEHILLLIFFLVKDK